MKLTPIIQKRSAPDRALTLNFTKTGILSFSKDAEKQIPEITTAKNVMILQDKEQPDDFYLHLFSWNGKTDNVHVNLRETNKKKKIANYRCAYEKILEHFRADHQAIKIPIGGRIEIDGLKYWPLITHVLKNKSK